MGFRPPLSVEVFNIRHRRGRLSHGRILDCAAMKRASSSILGRSTRRARDALAAQINPALILRMMEVADQLIADELGANIPHIAHNGPAGPCVVTWPGLPQTFGAIMPRRIDPVPMPAWVHAKTQAVA